MLYAFAVSDWIECLPFVVTSIRVEYLIDVLVDCDVFDHWCLPIFLRIIERSGYFLSFWPKMRLGV